MKSPSKFTALERLIEIEKNNCISATGIEYPRSEIEQLIVEKKNKSGEKLLKNFDTWLKSQVYRVKFEHKKSPFIPALRVEKENDINMIRFNPSLNGRIL